MREPTDAEVADWEDRQVAQQAHGGNDHKASRGCAECRAVFEPTTEPSAVERVLAYMNEWCVDFESVLAEIPEGRRAEHLAEIVRIIQSLAPAPQPAADTETEVQWGVRSDETGEVVKGWHDSALRHVTRTGEGTLMKRTVTTTRWEEA